MAIPAQGFYITLFADYISCRRKRGQFGEVFDASDIVEYGIGYTQSDLLKVTVYGDFDLYIIQEQSLIEIVRIFRELICQSYIPPKWAFGHGQSRWGCKNATDI